MSQRNPKMPTRSTNNQDNRKTSSTTIKDDDKLAATSKRKQLRKSKNPHKSTGVNKHPRSLCSVCEKPINDETEDSIFCDGICKGWMHRICAGLSKTAFNAASESDDNFFCQYCSSKCMRDEIKALKQKIVSLEASLRQHSTNDSQAPTLCAVQTNMDTTSHNKPQVLNSSPPKNSSLRNITTDRKYNIVIFGVTESPQGTPRFTRNQHDYTETSSILSKLYEDSNPGCSIRDCHRIGKYSGNSAHPRPILATLSTTAEVRHVITHCSSLPSSISIKPDRSSSERKVEKILLSERWKLIQSGSDRRTIKISNSHLYLNGHLHGKVVDSTYCLAPFLGDLAPTLSNLSNTSGSNGDDNQCSLPQIPAPSSSK